MHICALIRPYTPLIRPLYAPYTFWNALIGPLYATFPFFSSASYIYIYIYIIVGCPCDILIESFKKTSLGPGESEVCSGRGGGACPNQNKLKKPRVDAGMWRFQSRKQKKIKNLDLRESEVWSGRGGWACPLACRFFWLFWFSRVESSPPGHNPRFFQIVSVFEEWFRGPLGCGLGWATGHVSMVSLNGISIFQHQP